ncbi:hypothetical protein NBRC10512_002279 [Rhodotorula toruloides]|uniref:RHTO0S08e06678g1_1 n=2 Tax=Rhodotorula toruloides TaxID=5286 RepID=A0A061B7I3_RHOTO|nr:uncharacterized protein RHTO_00965 [Rhodotorula toruloides NP11]EMS22211.1 hypothetical protein RHTO_00965 [Rhodotorula toruloides NP11]CDR43835.1 RHTO0S08e06678g1_1 [Rhodotorula toruloides]
MPATLPLELVLDILRSYIQRDFFDEDWSPYHARLAPLCLVCKAFKDVVQPVLWSYLSPTAFEDPESFFGAKSAVRHLFKHVKGFAADRLYDYIVGRRQTGFKQAGFLIVQHALRQVETVRLCKCDASLSSIAGFAALRSLTLEGHEIFNVQEEVVFPHLHSLSLFDIRALEDGYISDLLSPSVTPSLRHLFVGDIWMEGARSSEAYLPSGDVDLSRVTVVELRPAEAYALPYDFWEPAGSFSPDAAVLISWDASDDQFFFDEPPHPFPTYFQLVVPPKAIEGQARDTFVKLCRCLGKFFEPEADCEGFKVAFLPSTLRHPANVHKRLRQSVKGLFSACLKGGVKVVFFRDTDETRGTISSAFLKYLEHPSQPDQNPLVVELQQQRGASRNMLWTALPSQHWAKKRK